MKKRRPTGAVWYLPERRRPIAHSTLCAKHTVDLMAKDYPTVTALRQGIAYDQEARDILQKYIDAGHGGTKPSDLFGE